MTWQQKAFIQKIFSALPFSYGVKLNFLCQKYITKGLPRSFEGFKGCYQGKVEKAFNSFKKYTNLKDFSSKSYFEFGAGWDLITPIGMSRKGMGHTYIIDIRELIIPSLIKTTISQYDKLLGYTSKQLGGGGNTKDLLQNTYNINYSIQDATRTNFPSCSMDFIASYVVLEHIPADVILNILKECFRIAKDGAIIVFLIDYQDHFSYFDKSISVYNYLTFTTKQWEKHYNPPLHYQNRLRHSDYKKFIIESGFTILEETPFMPTKEQEDTLLSLSLAEEFKKYSFDDLKILGSYFVLKKH